MVDLNKFDFNAENEEPMKDFGLIEMGKHLAVITESELTQTKKKDGHFLALTIQITEGQSKSRNLWVNLNMDNPSKDAVLIARAEFSSICRAIGVMRPGDSSELHNKPFYITVGQKKRKDTGELQNIIRKYEKAGAATGQPQQSTSNAAPWEGKA